MEQSLYGLLMIGVALLFIIILLALGRPVPNVVMIRIHVIGMSIVYVLNYKYGLLLGIVAYAIFSTMFSI